MAEGSDLTKAETEELNHELAVIRKAASGQLSFVDKEVLKVVGKVGLGGGAGVLLGRYAGARFYPRAEDTDQNNNAMMRHATEAAVGLGGAMAIRKVSPAAAVGFAAAAIADALANWAQPEVFSQLDDLFLEASDPRTAGEMWTESVPARRAAGGRY